MAIITITCLLHAQKVTLIWCPNTEPELAGYKVYYGSGIATNWQPTIYDTNFTPCPSVVLLRGTNWFRQYTNTIDVGNQTNCIITNLIPGLTYFFAVTAYDTARLESEPSDEVSYEVPLPLVLTSPKNFQILKVE